MVLGLSGRPKRKANQIIFFQHFFRLSCHYFDKYKRKQGNFKAGEFSPFQSAPKPLYNSGKAICGARGCTRACMISLERRGVLKNKFESPFRTSKPWSVDWEQEAISLDYKAPYEGMNSPNNRTPVESETD